MRRTVRRNAVWFDGPPRPTSSSLIWPHLGANQDPTWEPIRIPALYHLEAQLELSSDGRERAVAKRASVGVYGARAGSAAMAAAAVAAPLPLTGRPCHGHSDSW